MDKDLAERLLKSGVERAKDFSIEKIVSKYESLLI